MMFVSNVVNTRGDSRALREYLPKGT